MFRFTPKSFASAKRRPARRRFRPAVEAFEDRLVPAVLNPSPNVPDGQPGSLRDAIQTVDEAVQYDTIDLQAGVYQLSLVNTAGHESKADQGDLNLYPAGRTITIEGAGAGVTIIDGGAIDRVFQVESGVTVVLRNLTVRNGLAQDGGNDGDQAGTVPAYGGGILNEGNLTLDHVVVEKNSAVGGNGQNAVPGAAPAYGGFTAVGGGIFNSGTLTLLDSTVQNNVAHGGQGGDGIQDTDGAPGGAGIGGGIYSDGTLRVIQSTVANNTALGGAGGSGGRVIAGTAGQGGPGGAGLGGGLLIDPNAGQTVVTDSTIAGNVAAGAVGGDGGLGAAGVDPIIDSGHGGNGGNGEGGGINAGAIITVNNSTIAGNEADQGDGGPGGAAGLLQGLSGIGDGGGVFASEDPGQFVSVSTLIADNTAHFATPDFHGTFASAANTLLGNAEGANNITGGVNGNLVGVNPLLGPLQDNGGPTQTIALLPGSLAIDAGANPLGLATDQRGLARTVGATDIGAFEVQSVSQPTPPGVEPGVAPGNPPPIVAPGNPPPAAPNGGFHGTPPAAVTEHVVTAQVVKVHGHRLIRVYDGSGVLRFTIFPGASSFQVFTQDVNNDGYLDVLVTARHGRHVVTQAFSGLDGGPLPVSGV